MRAKRCPSRAEIIRYLEAEDPRKGASPELLQHIAACPDCRLVVEACSEVGFGAQELAKSLEALGLRSPAVARRMRAQAREEIGRMRKARGHGLRRWAAISATGAALALVAGLFFVLGRPQGPTDGRERGSFASGIRLARPKGKVSSRALEFVWAHEALIGTSRLEVYDQVLDPVYQSPPLAEDRFVLPEGVVSSLRPGRVYFWKVAGTLKDGSTVESEFTSFVLKK